MTDPQKLADSYAILKTSTFWSGTGKMKGYAVQNPGEAAKIDTYIEAIRTGQNPVPPTLATKVGIGLVGMVDAGFPYVAPPPPPPPPPPTSGAHEGRVKFFEYAGTSMWNYVSGGNMTAWQKAHWQMVEAYHPSWDPYTDDIPAVDYIDCSAIYKTSTGGPNLPQYALKDQTGAYVQFYGNSEFLADIGNPGWWDLVIGWCQTAKNAGFVGVKLDDVNLAPIPHSTPYKPINPRTGATYTDADWARDFADGLARVRAAFPKPFIVIHNSVWWNQPLSQPDIARAAQQCDMYMHERGAISNGDVTKLMEYTDQLHAWGVSAIYLASNTTSSAQVETNLAVALLASNGTDWQYNNDWEPDGWNPLNDTDLGDAKGPRYAVSGGWQRDFTKGRASYINGVGKVVVA